MQLLKLSQLGRFPLQSGQIHSYHIPKCYSSYLAYTPLAEFKFYNQELQSTAPFIQYIAGVSISLAE